MANGEGMVREFDSEDEDERPRRNVVALACPVDLEDDVDDAIVQRAEAGDPAARVAIERMARRSERLLAS